MFVGFESSVCTSSSGVFILASSECGSVRARALFYRLGTIYWRGRYQAKLRFPLLKFLHGAKVSRASDATLFEAAFLESVMENRPRVNPHRACLDGTGHSLCAINIFVKIEAAKPKIVAFARVIDLYACTRLFPPGVK